MLTDALKRGSAEFLILSLLEAEPRHGYELQKLIESRSEGVLCFHVAGSRRPVNDGDGSIA